MRRRWAYNRFGVLMGSSGLVSDWREPRLRGYFSPMITLFSSQGDFCAIAHAPFMSYKNVQSNSARCANTVNAAQLDQDIAAGQLADYSLYIPDLNDDGHDTGVGFADKWLQKAFDPKFKDPRFMQDMLVVVTFDEDDNRHGNNIYTVLLGDS